MMKREMGERSRTCKEKGRNELKLGLVGVLFRKLLKIAFTSLSHRFREMTEKRGFKASDPDESKT